jgi:polyisoprenoid-binding protein YceI
MRCPRSLPLVVLALPLALAPRAHAKLTRVGSATVVFAAKATGGVNILGTTPELALKDDGKTVLATVPLARLTTGLALRDKHMREKYLEVARYPNAQLSVERAHLRSPTSAPVSADAAGLMTIHGRSKRIVFHYAARRAGATIQVTATARLDLRDYGIVIPSFLGVTVKPEIDLTVTFAAEDR